MKNKTTNNPLTALGYVVQAAAVSPQASNSCGLEMWKRKTVIARDVSAQRNREAPCDGKHLIKNTFVIQIEERCGEHTSS